MGVCYSDDRKIRQSRLTNKTAYKYSENKILDNSENEKNAKKFEQFKIKEINCDTFYNINNNFNYSIIDNRNSAKNDESIQGLNLMNQPIENLTKENTCRNMNYLDSINAKEIINNDKYQKLLSYFKANMPHFPYNNLSKNQIDAFIKEYKSSKMESPYKYIESKNYNTLFNKIYELCFLKCEPLLNNINDNKKSINLLFLKTVIILLREKNFDETLLDLSSSIIELSYEYNCKYLKKVNFYKKIKSFCEICYQIIFYFIVGYSHFSEDQYYEYLNNQHLLIEDKYSNSDIDVYCLNKLFDFSKGSNKLDDITRQWSDFICGKINLDEFEEDNNFIKEEISNISLIKKKIIFMINPYHLLQILSGFKFPKV
jgi:hypothetical protein